MEIRDVESPAGTVVKEVDLGPWVVTMGWGGNQSKTAGPTHLRITFAEPPPEGSDAISLQRGITTGVLRDVEKCLTRVMARVRDELADRLTEGRDLFEAALADVRSHPITTDQGAYYTALLDAWDLLDASGDRTPNKTLGESLGVSPETIRTQMKKARSKARGDGV